MSKNDIASTMNSIMSSPKYQAVFTKTAAKKEEKEPKEKGNGKCKCKGKCQCKGKGKGKDPKKKGLNPFQKCVAGLASISKTLDDAKFEKAATYAVLALDALVKQAEEECADCGSVPTDDLFAKDKPQKKEDEEDEDEEDEEEDTEKKDDEEEDEEDEKEEDDEDEEEEDEDENDAWNWFGLKKDKQPAPAPSAQPAPPASNPQPTGWQPSQLAGAKGDPFGTGGVFDDRFESQLAGAEGDPMDPNLGDNAAVRDNLSMKDVLDIVQRIVQRERGGSPGERGGSPDIRAKMDEEGEYSALETDSTEPEIGDQRSREELYGVASKSVNSLIALAKELKGKTDPKAKVRNKSSAIFESTHSKVKDKKDHFPIDTAGRARNALARVNQFDAAPEWWSGSIKELKNAVVKAVKAKYPSIKVTEKSKS